ncbi:hypothetical protein ABZS66_04670 [Dactylosporangium sp. NPDC005572]|uniref:hypothetical protein n=1 Tax=Dactylosporangium sp. NPDC005572 TaxID=3156889 RepID=UPI0033BF9981
MPPLLLPRTQADPPPAQSPPPAATPSPTPAPSVPPCGTGAGSRPACAVYGAALGTGWSIESAGVKVVPAGVVPGTDQVALRVEPKEKTAFVALVATAAVTATTLRFRVYGGRVHGTVLRVTVAETAGRPAAAPVVLTAPVDVWTAFELDLAELLPGRALRRIDLVIATDMVPNAYRFFVDDVQLS